MTGGSGKCTDDATAAASLKSRTELMPRCIKFKAIGPVRSDAARVALVVLQRESTAYELRAAYAVIRVDKGDERNMFSSNKLHFV
jgi:hypothetical protein